MSNTEMQPKIRGFEPIKEATSEVNLPKRATSGSAGYDFEASKDTAIRSIWSIITKPQEVKQILKPTLVPTNVKAYMPEDEYLQLNNRSSNPLKNFLALANGVGIIDSDYYSNPDNDGHIMFQFINFGLKTKIIKKGDRIGQGIFLKFLTADNDTTTAQRTGGFGSTTESKE